MSFTPRLDRRESVLQRSRNSLLDGIVSYAEFFKNRASALPEDMVSRAMSALERPGP
ncbi:MAG TPA: hypothetical protein VER17_11215 [Tepidisphaeraceae bacterium]|nr:hypothetical protein [Tepidisphaeraceae bacterium]